MVAKRIPLNDLQFGEKEAIYVANLERRMANYEVQLTRFRSLLEMMTGDQWDDVNINVDLETLKAMATTATAKRLAVQMEQANRIVDERIAAANSGTMPGARSKVEYVTEEVQDDASREGNS